MKKLACVVSAVMALVSLAACNSQDKHPVAKGSGSSVGEGPDHKKDDAPPSSDEPLPMPTQSEGQKAGQAGRVEPLLSLETRTCDSAGECVRKTCTIHSYNVELEIEAGGVHTYWSHELEIQGDVEALIAEAAQAVVDRDPRVVPADAEQAEYLAYVVVETPDPKNAGKTQREAKPIELAGNDLKETHRNRAPAAMKLVELLDAHCRGF